MFDPNAITIAQIRYEEMRSNVQYERMIRPQTRRTPLHQRLLAGMGHLMVAWGTVLQERYGEAKTRTQWTGANRRMERAL